MFTHDGKWLAKAAYSPESQIRARIWSFERRNQQSVFREAFQDAQLLREDVIARDGLTGYRLIAAESDGLPGVTIDRYQTSSYVNCSAQAQNTTSKRL